IAHEATLRAFARKLSAHPFAHNAKHDLDRATLIDSYHCSRYNTNTGKLTTPMFEAVFAQARALLR
ncbi:MAG: uracil-DNA glycosylase, partial [Alphaproteobacteria bacterium]|nr:uracil-DNA glycosylase [Alphaproteobacteria bacterium]